jgi:ABC-type Fe3+ transport system substrate-binding protein
MKTPRVNWILLAVYILSSLGIFIASLVSPAFRVVAAAPLRDLILPPPEPVNVLLLYSTEKDAWLKAVLTGFEGKNIKIDGHPVKITLKKMGSREMVLAVLDGKIKPDMISPASMLQATMLADQSEKKIGKTLLTISDPLTCVPVVKTPLVLVTWKERVDALWGQNPPVMFWESLHDALIDPQGWQAYGHPEWGYIKFGHTNPEASNSGLMTLLSMSIDYLGKPSGLKSSDILANSEYQAWLSEIESTISQFGESTGTYMNDIVAYGPSVYDFVSVYEATAIEQADNARGRYGELKVYYPSTTIMSDHPFCLVSAEWVSPEKQKAATEFREYLLSNEAQQLALMDFGFRPSDTTIDLNQSVSPFMKYSAMGVKNSIPPEINIPDVDFLNTLLDFWNRKVNVK